MELLTMLWKENPDYRFGQFLINTGLVEDTVSTWRSGIPDLGICHEDLRSIQTWGSYDKDSNKYKDNFIKDLEDEHIQNILKTQVHISGTYIEKVLLDEVDFRADKSNKSETEK